MPTDDVLIKQIPAVRVAELTGVAAASSPSPSARSSDRSTTTCASASTEPG